MTNDIESNKSDWEGHDDGTESFLNKMKAIEAEGQARFENEYQQSMAKIREIGIQIKKDNSSEEPLSMADGTILGSIEQVEEQVLRTIETTQGEEKEQVIDAILGVIGSYIDQYYEAVAVARRTVQDIMQSNLVDWEAKVKKVRQMIIDLGAIPHFDTHPGIKSAVADEFYQIAARLRLSMYLDDVNIV